MHSRRRVWRVLVLAALAVLPMAATACFQQSNTYPVEVLSEMHYAQFNRAQEPPRLAPPASAVAFQSGGSPESQLAVPDRRERPYDMARAAELYRVNCTVCHGGTGLGDGPAAAHLMSSKNYFASKAAAAGQTATYAAPANLQAALVRQGFTEDVAYATIRNGVLVMPRFGALLSEEDIRDIVNYLFDEQGGIAAFAP
jgi:mono/diheme cytochrome c family protein